MRKLYFPQKQPNRNTFNFITNNVQSAKSNLIDYLKISQKLWASENKQQESLFYLEEALKMLELIIVCDNSGLVKSESKSKLKQLQIRYESRKFLIQLNLNKNISFQQPVIDEKQKQMNLNRQKIIETLKKSQNLWIQKKDRNQSLKQLKVAINMLIKMINEYEGSAGQFYSQKLEELQNRLFFRELEISNEFLTGNQWTSNNNSDNQQRIQKLIKKTIINLTYFETTNFIGYQNEIKQLQNTFQMQTSNINGTSSACTAVLLYGTSGNGKTFMAKVYAKQTNRTFFNFSLSHFCQLVVCKGEKLIKLLFEIALLLKPSIIFINDIDFMCSSPVEKANNLKQMKDELLLQIKQNQHGNDILIIGNSSKSNEVSEQLFSKRIFIRYPNFQQRSEKLKKRLIVEQQLKYSQFAGVIQRTQNFHWREFQILIEDAIKASKNRLITQKTDQTINNTHKQTFDPKSRSRCASMNNRIQMTKGTTNQRQIKKFEINDCLDDKLNEGKKTKNNWEYLPGLLQFKQAVNCLHFCRLIYKYLLLQENQKSKDNNLIKLMSTVMFNILKQVTNKIEQKQITYGDQIIIKEQKIRNVASQCYLKYSQSFQQYSSFHQISYQIIIKLCFSKLAQYQTQFFNNIQCLEILHYLMTILESSQLLKRCSESGKYLQWGCSKNVQQFLIKTNDSMSKQWYLQRKNKLKMG